MYDSRYIVQLTRDSLAMVRYADGKHYREGRNITREPRDKTGQRWHQLGGTQASRFTDRPVCKVYQKCRQVAGNEVKCSNAPHFYPKPCRMAVQINNGRIREESHEQMAGNRQNHFARLDRARRQNARLDPDRGGVPTGRTPYWHLLEIRGVRAMFRNLARSGGNLKSIARRKELWEQTKDEFEDLTNGQPYPFETFRELLRHASSAGAQTIRSRKGGAEKRPRVRFVLRQAQQPRQQQQAPQPQQQQQAPQPRRSERRLARNRPDYRQMALGGVPSNVHEHNPPATGSIHGQYDEWLSQTR